MRSASTLVLAVLAAGAAAHKSVIASSSQVAACPAPTKTKTVTEVVTLTRSRTSSAPTSTAVPTTADVPVESSSKVTESPVSSSSVVSSAAEPTTIESSSTLSESSIASSSLEVSTSAIESSIVESSIASTTSIVVPTTTIEVIESTSDIAPEPVTTSAEPVTTSAEPTSEAPSSTAQLPLPDFTNFPRAYPADVVDDLRDESIAKLEEFLGTTAQPSGGCTLENVAIRREWSDLSVDQRKEYISAVQCLQSKPPKTPASVAAGAKSRFDDFLVTHIQQTPTIHNTANFLAWHRYYVWAYETALRDECGYTGFQPYWNWDRYANDPENSPLFNGDEASLSGNSRNGGCVETGPFKDMSVNLGPGNSLRYNPRCLKRAISRSNAQSTKADRTLPLITQSRDIGSFQNTLQLPQGVHANGHFTIGGDPAGDIYSSPGDPAFYLHHAMVDRVWWIWQLQDLETRLTAVAGNTGSYGNGGARGTLNDLLNLGYNGGNVALGSLLNTMGGKGGEFCYIYA
ncbi:hypothetical protein B0I35DRAFT_477288 [Stachybotrys elegans]|uniref:Tyrosinase copper-binding domain-containing protein n=1 Tax=Stachybotrys elegans TaxID=80388 RepID=A0A8K0SYX0_9HYPO|nr:hypothetical protein B0I35DRAFT_477288 [Stachybotrys elegans]